MVWCEYAFHFTNLWWVYLEASDISTSLSDDFHERVYRCYSLTVTWNLIRTILGANEILPRCASVEIRDAFSPHTARVTAPYPRCSSATSPVASHDAAIRRGRDITWNGAFNDVDTHARGTGWELHRELILEISKLTWVQILKSIDKTKSKTPGTDLTKLIQDRLLTFDQVNNCVVYTQSAADRSAADRALGCSNAEISWISQNL